MTLGSGASALSVAPELLGHHTRRVIGKGGRVAHMALVRVQTRTDDEA